MLLPLSLHVIHTFAPFSYQSRKRGILEMDLLLSTFTIKHLPGMDAVELDALDRLMDENDWDVYYVGP